MRPRTALALAVTGAVVLAGGWYFGPHAVQVPEITLGTGEPAFPGIDPKLQHAERIEITQGGKTLAIALHDGVWGVAERGYYPVQQPKVHELLTGLAELRLLEKRTSDPALFARLGVEDAAAPTANSDLVRILDAGGQEIAAIIVGHRSIHTAGNAPDSIYVRMPGQNQCWLAEGRLSPDASVQEWFDRDVVNIDHSRIASISVVRDDPDGEHRLEFAAHDGKLELAAPAQHPPLDDAHLDDISRALELVTFTDVQQLKNMPGKKVGQAVFRTDDGLSVTVAVNQAGSDIWAHFTVDGTGKAEQEAKQLNARVADWAYQLGSWKEASLLPTLGYLKATPPARPAPAASQPDLPHQ